MQKIGAALTFVMLCFTCIASAQTAIIKGKITQGNNHEVLPGVNVYFEGTTIGSASNNNGNYQFKINKAGTYDLIVSYSGYKRIRETVTINAGDNVFNFEMSESKNKLGEVVITGTGTPHHLKSAPVPTEIISKKTIESIGAPDFEHLMMTLSPSFDFNPGTMGSLMKLNGLGNDFILVLINGKRIYGDVGGNSDLNRINPDDIERIEIVKGASSLLYGTDAIAGVINIITKKSNQKVHVSNASRIRSFNTWQQNNALDLNIGKLSSRTSFTKKHSDGWQLSKYELDDDKLVETEAQAQIEYDDYTISQHLDYDITKKLSVYAEGSYYEKDRFRPQSVGKYGYYFEDVTLGAGAKYLINQRDFITLDYHNDHNKYYYRYNQEYKDYAKGDLSINNDQQLSNVQLKYIKSISKNNKLSLGADYLNEKMVSDRVIGGEADVNTYAFLAQDELKFFENLNIVAGARLVKHEEFGTALIPKVSALYRWNKINLRGTYGLGYKAPTLKELYYEYHKGSTVYMGNTDLDPQKSQYSSLGLEYNTQKTSFSVSAYRNDVDDLIDYKSEDLQPGDTEDGIKTRRKHYNIDKTRSQGIDMLFNTLLGAGFSIGGGYSYVDAKDLTNDVKLEGVAENYGNIHLDYNYTADDYTFGASITGRFQDEKFYDDGNAKGYQLLNFSTRQKFTAIKNMNIELTAGIDNILDFVDDSPYGSHYGTLSPGRTFFMGVTINFSK